MTLKDSAQDIDDFVSAVEKVFGKVRVTVKQIHRQDYGEMELYMLKQGNSLLSNDYTQAEALESIPDGDVKVEISRPRNVKFHRKFFSLLKVAFDQWDKPIAYHKGIEVAPSFDEFRKNITILCGWYVMDVDIKGTMRARAKSISFGKMDEIEFEHLYNKAVDVIIMHVLPRWTKQELDLFVSKFG